MARIGYPEPAAYENEPLVARIKRERGGKLVSRLPRAKAVPALEYDYTRRVLQSSESAPRRKLVGVSKAGPYVPFSQWVLEVALDA